jgi:hypothetical protein
MPLAVPEERGPIGSINSIQNHSPTLACGCYCCCRLLSHTYCVEMASMQVLDASVVAMIRSSFAITSLAQAVEEVVCNGTVAEIVQATSVQCVLSVLT